MKLKNNISKLVVALTVIGLTTTGCKKYFEDYVVTPNDPAEVTPGLLLTTVQVSTFATFGGQLARQSGILVQHVSGTQVGSQSLEVANYIITEQTNENEWNGMYTGAVMNANILIRDYGGESPYYAGIAKVLLAMNIGLATDLWGDVPFSDASGGETGNLTPKYDTQEQILAGIQSTLDEAIVDLQMAESDNVNIPSTDDLIFEGDVSMWIKTAYGLKARYANRLSQRDPGNSATDALAAVTNAMQSTADDCNMVFGGGVTSQNQWYAYGNDRANYILVSETFVDSLYNRADPRLEALVGKDENDSISGTPFDDPNVISASYLSDYYASANSSVPLVSYVEMKFIEAEAKLRSGDVGGAATAHNDAIKESILQITGAPDPTYEGMYASETASTISLEKIMFQKWIALFAQCEAYADWRRTGFPMLTSNPNATMSQIPLRFVTPQNERLYNPNAVVVGDLTQPVWWDQ